MNPEEAVFRSHVMEAPFQAGLDREQWGFHGSLDDIIWPHVTLWIQADATVMPSRRVHLLFDLQGYSQTAPTARPWDVEKNAFLEHASWPKGSGNVAKIFNPGWNGGTALYAPCDRMAMKNHDQWKAEFPGVWWERNFTIVHYLRFIHACLNRERYAKPDSHDSNSTLVASAA